MSKLKEYKLDELYKMDSGISTTKEQAGHGASFVSFSDIYNNEILPDELTQKMDTTEEEQEKYSVKEGDIFLTRTSEVLDELAMSSVAIKDYPNTTFSGFAKRLRPLQNDITYHKFMAFYLRSQYFRKIINSKAVMTLRASFNEAIFSYIKIMLPEYNLQVKAGDLFYDIEKKIRTNKKISTELESMARMIYEYWFLQFEFPDENGKPYKSSAGKMIWNKELKREIPEGWAVSKLSKLCDFSNGINYDKNETGDKNYRIVNVRNITASTLLLNTHDFDQIELKKSQAEKFLLESDDILIARSGTPGAIRLVLSDLKNIIYCGFIIKGKPKDKKYRYLLTYALKMLEGSNATKTGGSILQNVSQETLKQVNICVPSDEVIEKFNNMIEPMLEKMQEIILENNEWISFREFLLPLLMTGQVGFNR